MNSFILREQFFNDDIDCLTQRYISEKRINIKTCHEEIGIWFIMSYEKSNVGALIVNKLFVEFSQTIQNTKM